MNLFWILNKYNLLPDVVCLQIAGCVANSVDPDEMPHSVASHLGCSGLSLQIHMVNTLNSFQLQLFFFVLIIPFFALNIIWKASVIMLYIVNCNFLADRFRFSVHKDWCEKMSFWRNTLREDTKSLHLISLCWALFGQPRILHADIKNSDQNVQMCRLIR